MAIEQLIAHYGLIALFLGAGIEGETVVMLGGMMAHRGLFGFWPAIAVAAAGSFLADQIFFLLGRRFKNLRLVRRVTGGPAYARALAIFQRRPVLFMFAFRFIYGLRTVSPIAIGTTGISPARFALINAVAAIVWALVFVTLGYSFGAGVESLFGRIGAVEHLVIAGIALAAIVAAGGWLIRRRRDPAGAVTPGSTESPISARKDR